MDALGVLKGIYHSVGWQLDTRTLKNHYQWLHFFSNNNKVSRHLHRSMMWDTTVISSHILTHSMSIRGLWITYFCYMYYFVWRSRVIKTICRRRCQTQTAGSRNCALTSMCQSTLKIFINMLINRRLINADIKSLSILYFFLEFLK